MTTLAAWVAADQRGPASVYLAADSRITWSSSTKWDFGRKLFASQTSPEIVGFAGDAFFPTQSLGQLVELIDRGVAAGNLSMPQQRLQWLVDSLERAARSYPTSRVPTFSILYGTRLGEFMNSTFEISRVNFRRGRTVHLSRCPIPQTSGLIEVLGTGEDAFRNVYIEWQAREVGGTSRAIFSAFAEHLSRGDDPSSGGPPQLVGLIRKGPAKTFGTIWNQRRYFSGLEIANIHNEASVSWHNELFEICNPGTLTLAEGAQLQPKPKNHGRDLSKLRKRPLPLP